MITGLLFMVSVLVFVTIVAPLWIVVHYVTRWRTAKVLSPEDEQSLAELSRLTERLERRMEAIERILDADHAPRERNSGDYGR